MSSIAPLTHDMPGAHLIICRAGRNVSPVVLSAPLICPSAPSVLIIIHPRYRGFFTNSRAFSIVIPFFLRSSASKVAYSSALGLFSGSIRVALSILVNPHSLANLCTSSGLPMRIRSATSSARTLSAALNVRSSVASGSTMRCLLLLARSMIFWTKSIVCFLNMFFCNLYFAISRCKSKKKNREYLKIHHFFIIFIYSAFIHRLFYPQIITDYF